MIKRSYFKSTAGRKFNNPNAMYVELTFASTPVIDITRASLLYDKKVFVGFRFDDTYKNAFINSKAVFFGGPGNLDENNNQYTGRFYTDNCGNDLSFVADFAIQMAVVTENPNATYLSNDDLIRAKNYGYGILTQGCYITQTIDIGNPKSTEPYSVWAADCQEFADECFSRFKFRPTVGTSDYGRDEWTSIDDNGTMRNPLRDSGCLFFSSGTNPKELAGVPTFNDIENGLDADSVTSDSFVAGLPFPCLYTSSRILKYPTVADFPSTPEAHTVYHSIETGLEYRSYDDTYYAVTAIKRYNTFSAFPSTGVADAIYIDLSNYNAYSYNSGYILLNNVETYSSLPATGVIGTIYRNSSNSTYYRWSTELNGYYTIQESFSNSRPVQQIREMIDNAVDGTTPRIISIFTHQLSFDEDDNDNGGYYFPYWMTDYIDWLESNYGKSGTDDIVVASMNTIAEYLYCREKTIINTYSEGNKVILEIIPPTDRALRRPSLTLKLTSNINVVETAIVNIDRFSENVVGNTSGIINVEWSDEWYNTANEAVTTAENTQLQADVDEATYFVSLVSNINKYNSLMARLNAIVVIADINHLIDFSRNVSTYISAQPYNDIHDFSPTSTDVVILDESGVDNGIRFNILTNSYNTYYKTDVINTGIYPDLVRKDGIQISSAGPIGTFSLSNLDPTKTYSLKFYGYKAYSTGPRGLADIRVYNNALLDSVDSTQEYDPSNNLTTTCDFANISPNESGIIYIDITAKNGVTTVLSAMEIMKHN